MRRFRGKSLSVFAAAVVCTTGAAALGQQSIGADVIVGELPDLSNNAAEGAFDAFAVGTTSCNKGNVPLNWFTGGTDNRHPVIGQNLFRLYNGRFEQVGQAWLKHGFTALQGGVCTSAFGFPCTSTAGTTLGTGCSDPYSSGLNNGQSGLGPKWQVNAATGLFPYPFASPAFSGSTARRLRVRIADMDPANFPGARYFIEGQYVCGDDAGVGNKNNNASYREVGLLGACCSSTGTCTAVAQSSCIGTSIWLGYGVACSPTTICTSTSGSCCAANGSCVVTTRAACTGRWFGSGTCAAGACAFTNPEIAFAANSTTQREKPGIQAWKDLDPTITLVSADIANDGRFLLACKVTQSGSNYTYEYALHNLNSHRCAGSFTVPFPSGTSVSGVGFRDVEYHSGEPNAVDPANPSVDDWASNIGATQITWAGPSYAGAPPAYAMAASPAYLVSSFTAGTGNDHSANVLRWGTMFNYRFTTTVAPSLGSVQIGLWRPGTPASFSMAIPTPAGATSGISTGPCCIGSVCSITTPGACTGTFGTIGATCTPDPCATGACCLLNGTCNITSGAGCSGTWTLNGSCTPNNCPAPTGACCVGAACSVTTAGACAGAYRGDGVTCAAANCVAAPLNDGCPTAIALCDGVPIAGTCVGASDDGDASCAGTSGSGASVWYKYTPSGTTGTVSVTFDTCTASYDSAISVWSGACPGVTQVGCDDDACGSLHSRVTVTLNRGQAYLVRVAGYNGAVGTFTLTATGGGGTGCQGSGSCCVGTACTTTTQAGCAGTWTTGGACSPNPCDVTGQCCSSGNCAVVAQSTCNGTFTAGATCTPNPCPPLNNDCSGRAGLGLGTTPFDTTNATTDGPADALCLNSGDNQVGKDIWYNHPVTFTGTLDIDTCGSSFDTKIAVYTGSVCTDLATRIIACNDDAACPGANLQSKLTLNVVAGEHYTIRIGGYNDASGAGQVTLTAHPTPTGSCCGTDGSCLVTTEAACTGAWTDGGACSPNNCPQPTGACCSTTTCSVTTQAGCSGTFQGVGSVCDTPGNPVMCCKANFNASGGLSVQDIFDFLAAYFSNSPSADFNGQGGISVQDIFDFLAAYFAGCPG